MKKISIAALTLLAVLMTGCSDDSEEKAFRASLIEKALNDDNRKKGVAFLAENATKQDVVSLASGVQYKVLQQGSGDKASIEQSVKVNYSGKLVTGEVFDSSAARGNSSLFPLKSVIAGWRIALMNMRVGDRWEVYLPADLAYGARSPSEKIPANSALIFDIELLEIVSEENE